MRVIRYWTSHENPSAQFWKERFGLLESDRLIYDSVTPEYLFATEHIYSTKSKMRKFLSFRRDQTVSIFFAGEAIVPDLNLFDYASSFDRQMSDSLRVVRRHPAHFFKKYFDVDSIDSVDPGLELRRKGNFCNFIYANAKAHPRRDQLFHLISGYKRVDSLGPHLNNCGNTTSRTSIEFHKLLVEMKSPYKFSIAAENAAHDGYSTEKLISSFQAHTVPIYWGDKTISEDYNPKSFINANEMTDVELLDEIRRIDECDSAWCEMIAQPPMTPLQRDRLNKEMSCFYRFFARVFDDSISIAQKKRVAMGFWNDIYQASVSNKTKWASRLRGVASNILVRFGSR